MGGVFEALRPFERAPSGTDDVLRYSYRFKFRRNVKRLRGGLVVKAARLVYHSILGSGVMKQVARLQG